MNYYDRNRNKFKFNILNMNLLGQGTCGKVYRYNDIAVKIYDLDTPNHIRLKPEKFDKLKNINNPHFIKLYNIYARKIIPFRINHNFITSIYTSKYYEPDKQSIIEKPIDYFLDNLFEIEKLLDYLTSIHILTDDLRYHNVILQENEIVLIDPDTFNYYTDSQDYIGYRNKNNLLELINTILYWSIREYDESIYNNWIFNLFKFNVTNSTDITNEVSKKFKKYKTLKNFFLENQR